MRITEGQLVKWKKDTLSVAAELGYDAKILNFLDERIKLSMFDGRAIFAFLPERA